MKPIVLLNHHSFIVRADTAHLIHELVQAWAYLWRKGIIDRSIYVDLSFNQSLHSELLNLVTAYGNQDLTDLFLTMISSNQPFDKVVEAHEECTNIYLDNTWTYPPYINPVSEIAALGYLDGLCASIGTEDHWQVTTINLTHPTLTCHTANFSNLSKTHELISLLREQYLAKLSTANEILNVWDSLFPSLKATKEFEDCILELSGPAFLNLKRKLLQTQQTCDEHTSPSIFKPPFKWRDESNTVLTTPAMLNERLVTCPIRGKTAITMHADLTDGDRLYFDHMPSDNVCILGYAGTHLTTAKN